MSERADKKPTDVPQETSSKRRQREVIGKELRRMFDDVAAEPIPDDFMALLDQLEQNSSVK